MKLALHYYAACPFCQMVLRRLPELNIDVELRDVLSQPTFAQEQRQATGRSTVPCLRMESDDGTVSWMYESMDILQHLQKLAS
ncbi:glutaredoxin [Bacterioplanes sanyensis]|uniref:Glutaredoxin n=1 Tax=Bacterioplanes sanyensis TaxID=1249553 RepID=A0A222FKZ0_9GAMM|nr:glutathione S-transferase N-terminal domain-containing protein [Bacterioplanes sanyensis]ASP39440.1 glutaredoxin [Bacterioplanes sanyensis]